jgi:hypothetical protein
MDTIDPSLLLGISGRYQVQLGAQFWDVRIDVDGSSPLNVVSGDCFSVQSGARTYIGSFLARVMPGAGSTPTEAQFSGVATFEPNGFVLANNLSTEDLPQIFVTIPRLSRLSPPPPAQLIFTSLNSTDISVAGTAPPVSLQLTLSFTSSYFRSVTVHETAVAGITPFSKYVGIMPPAGMGIKEAYAGAGIEVNRVSSSLAAPNGKTDLMNWTLAELHGALIANAHDPAEPAWDIWMFHVGMLVDPAVAACGLYRGLMFEQTGSMRRSASAIFYNAGIAYPPGDPVGQGSMLNDDPRLQLHTCVHEMGHCFNLVHAWTVNNPGPNALTWMNYPDRFGSPSQFWAQFKFAFATVELQQLRHGAFPDIIMTDSNFLQLDPTTDAATSASGPAYPPRASDDLLSRQPGLELRLETRPSFALGEPVVVEIRLQKTGHRRVEVHRDIHPDDGYVRIMIRQPDGSCVAYEPLMQRCGSPRQSTLDDHTPALYESAYIGYGKRGLYFHQAGAHYVRAAYRRVAGGGVIFSNVITVRIRAPHTSEDEALADLLLGGQQGALFHLQGSGSEYLRDGNRAFDELLTRFPDNPSTTYVRLTRGMHYAKGFKSIAPGQTIHAVPPNVTEAKTNLEKVHQATATRQYPNQSGAVDNITLGRAIRHLAKVQFGAGDHEGAQKTIVELLKTFEGQRLRPEVMREIRRQADEVLEPSVDDETKPTSAA